MEEVTSRPEPDPGCPKCAELSARVAELEAELVQALKRIKELEARLNENSSNSHRPPSSDPPNAPKRPGKPKTGRKRGGQIGHKGTRRELFPPEEVDHFVHHRPECCENCHASLPTESRPGDPPPERHQVTELPEKLYEVTEHQLHTTTCDRCGHVNKGELPAEVAGSNFGPRLAAVATFLLAACHVSRRRVREFFTDVVRTPIALGTVSNMEREATAALKEPYEEAAEAVSAAGVKNVDETSWKQSGTTQWLWVAATPLLALFAVANRGADGLRKLLGEKLFGVLVSDRLRVYNARAKRFRQICWSHLNRDFRKLIARGGPEKVIGERLRAIGTGLFAVWRDFKAGEIDRETLIRCLRPLRAELKSILQDGARLEGYKCAIFCENLLLLEPALWTFMRVEGVAPTNNHAERTLRTGVLWRKMSFGSQSDRGCEFVARVLTVVQSRRLQNKPVVEFLVEALRSHRESRPAPSLLPS
jgi:transposase